MRKLLELAARSADHAEVFSLRSDTERLQMRNGAPTRVSASMQSGFGLRLLRDGMMGTAYTKNLIDRRKLVENALASLKGEVKAGFTFPGRLELPPKTPFDGSVEAMGFRDQERYCRGAFDLLHGRVDGQIDVDSGKAVTEISIANTCGLDVLDASTRMYMYAAVLFPNTESSVHRFRIGRSAGGFEEDDVDALVGLYRAGVREVAIPSGRMKVLFTPDTLYTLLWRLAAGASGKSFHSGVSPLMGREGQRVLSEKISYGGDPTDPGDVDQRFFDDEGVPTSRRMFFDRGVFTGPVLNLDYAAKLGVRPTGNGYRQGDEPVASLPSPGIECPVMAPGDATFENMVASMERGVIALGALGAHSGNILNGDFSVGLAPGYYVENGSVVGRVKDGMITGNAYEVLRNVVSVEDRLHCSVHGGRYPALLLDDVSVAAKRSP